MESKTATEGACYGQAEIAMLDGLDLISAERARQLAAKAGLPICEEEVPDPQRGWGPQIQVYTWRSERDVTIAALFGDTEFRKEALELPNGGPYDDGWLPSPNWIVRTSDSAILQKAGVSAIVDAVKSCSKFRSVSRGRVPNMIVVVKRGPLVAWGKAAPYDIYFRFGKSEIDRFQESPAFPVIFSGRVEPALDLVQTDPFTKDQ